MITCSHCESEATSGDDDVVEGDALKCATCGILGTVYQGDRDVSYGDYTEAVGYLGFEASDGERCTHGDCEECRGEP